MFWLQDMEVSKGLGRLYKMLSTHKALVVATPFTIANTTAERGHNNK
jgi:hypothetical protein